MTDVSMFLFLCSQFIYVRGYQFWLFPLPVNIYIYIYIYKYYFWPQFFALNESRLYRINILFIFLKFCAF